MQMNTLIQFELHINKSLKTNTHEKDNASICFNPYDWLNGMF